MAERFQKLFRLHPLLGLFLCMAGICFSYFISPVLGGVILCAGLCGFYFLPSIQRRILLFFLLIFVWLFGKEVYAFHQARQFVDSLALPNAVVVKEAKVLSWAQHERFAIVECRILSGEFIGFSEKSLRGVRASLIVNEMEECSRFSGRVKFKPYDAGHGLQRFNLKAFHHQRLIAFKGELVEMNELQPMGQFRKIIRNAQQGVKAVLLNGVNLDSSAQVILPALVLGEKRKGVDEYELFQELGAAHFFVVSGFHVGIVSSLVWVGVYWLKLGRRVRLITVISLTWGYVLLSGAEPASVRAGIMISALFSAGLFYRKTSFYNSLLIAACLILFFEPMQLLQVGFLLSFGTVLLLVTFTPLIRKKVECWCEPDAYLPKSLWNRKQAVRTSLLKFTSGYHLGLLIAFLGSSFIVAFCFKKIYWWGFLLSLILTPCVYLIMGLSALSLTLNVFTEKGSVAVNRCNQLIIEQVHRSIEEWSVGKSNAYYFKDSFLKEGVICFPLKSKRHSLYFAKEQTLMHFGSQRDYEKNIKPVLEGNGIELQTIFSLRMIDDAEIENVLLFPAKKEQGEWAFHEDFTARVNPLRNRIEIDYEGMKIRCLLKPEQSPAEDFSLKELDYLLVSGAYAYGEYHREAANKVICYPHQWESKKGLQDLTFKCLQITKNGLKRE